VWIATHDATNEDAGVRCELVEFPWTHRAERVIRDTLKIFTG